jgi:hypothetical protein
VAEDGGGAAEFVGIEGDFEGVGEISVFAVTGVDEDRGDLAEETAGGLLWEPVEGGDAGDGGGEVGVCGGIGGG